MVGSNEISDPLKPLAAELGDEATGLVALIRSADLQIERVLVAAAGLDDEAAAVRRLRETLALVLRDATPAEVLLVFAAVILMRQRRQLPADVDSLLQQRVGARVERGSVL